MDNIQKKSPLIFYLLGGIVVLAVTYSALQYVIFSKRYEQSFLATAHIFEERFKNTFTSYNIVLSEFAKEIKKKDLFLEPKKLIDLFKKTYTYGLEDTKGEKLHLSAMNWVDKRGNLKSLRNQEVTAHFLYRLSKTGACKPCIFSP